MADAPPTERARMHDLATPTSQDTPCEIAGRQTPGCVDPTTSANAKESSLVDQTDEPGPSGLRRLTANHAPKTPSDRDLSSGRPPPNSKHCWICGRDVSARNFSAHLRSLSHTAREWRPIDDAIV
nr:unnamed protein product [Callosobruchus analis]